MSNNDKSLRPVYRGYAACVLDELIDRYEKETRGELFASVSWCEEDIANALECNDYEVNVENISAVYNNLRTARMIDCQVEAGWNYLYYVISEAAEKGEIK